MQNVADILARLMVFAGSHRGVIKDLAYDSKVLTDKLRDLCRLRDDMFLPIHCFFESYATDYGRRFGVNGLFREMVCSQDPKS